MITPGPVLIAGVGPSGGSVIAPLIRLNEDGVPISTVGLVVGSFNYIFNGAEARWDRQESGDATIDGMVPSSLGNTLVISQNYGWNPFTNVFDRLHAYGNDEDSFPVESEGNLSVNSVGFGFNGFAFDRLWSVASNADAIPVQATGQQSIISQSVGFNGVTFDRIWAIGSNTDAVPSQATGQQSVVAQLYGYNGASFDRVRVANVYNTVVATAAGSTTVWTPAAGKKFRLMGYTISIAGTASATGVQVIKLEDGATVIKNHLATVDITTPVGDSQIGADLGQGQLSAVANNVLNINLSEAMATGGVAVNVWGTEE